MEEQVKRKARNFCLLIQLFIFGLFMYLLIYFSRWLFFSHLPINLERSSVYILIGI